MSYSPVLGMARPQYMDTNGDPEVNYTLTFYVAGTTTLLDTYTDSTGATANDNPLTLNSRGQPESDAGAAVMIYGANGTVYKAVRANAAGTVVETLDNIYPGITLTGAWENPLVATRTTATTFTIAGADHTTTFHPGRRAYCEGEADRYLTTTSSTFAAGDTVVTVQNVTDGATPPVPSTLHASMTQVSASIIPNYTYSAPHGLAWIISQQYNLTGADTITQDIVIQSGGHLNITAATTLNGKGLIEPGGQLTIGAATTLGAAWVNHGTVTISAAPTMTTGLANYGTITFTTTQTLAADIEVFPGGTIDADTGVTGTLSGPFSAGPYNVFTGLGIITLTGDVAERYIQWYGCAGDDSTDNLAAMNTLVAGAYYAPEGTYLLSDTYILPSNINIRGAGLDKTIFKADTAGSFSVIASSTRTGIESDDGEKTNMHLSDMTIDGNTTATAGVYSALYFTFANLIRLKNIKAINADDACIRIDGYGQTFEDGAYLDSDALGTSPIDTTNTSTTVTINHDRHGVNTNALVTLAGCATTNGVPDTELNAEHSVTVVNDNSYTIVVTTAATSTGSGGGSSVVASNARHSTRWSQSSDFRIENCIADNGDYGIEIEGGAYNGTIKGCKTRNCENHNIRITSGEDITIADNDMDGGQTGIWIDRSRRLRVRDNAGKNITLHGMPVGIVHDSKFKDNDFQITDTATYTGITDNYNRTVAGVNNCLFEGNSSNGQLQLIGGTDNTIVKHNIMDIDVVRAANSNIIVEDNIGTLTQGSGLDAGSLLLGGNVHVMRHFNSGVPARYSQVPYLGIRAYCVFDGTNTGTFAPDQSVGVDDITRNSAGNYTINLTDNMYTTNYGVLTICQWHAANAAQISRLVSKATTGPNILSLDSSFSPVDSNNITVIILGT